MKPEDIARIETAKAASTFQLLFKAARLVNDASLERVRRSTGMALKPSHTQLFPHIDFEGTRVSVLAERLGISKQAVSQLVDELEAMGGLERVPDPADGRARLVKFREGALMKGLEELQHFEADLADDVGLENLAHLRRTLAAIISAL